MSECPKCKQAPRHSRPMVCDNGCDTIHCEYCKREFFIDENGTIRMGHAPWCEDSNSSYVGDSSYESYESSDNGSDNGRESEDSNGERSYTNESDDNESDDNESDDNESYYENESEGSYTDDSYCDYDSYCD